MSNKGWILFPSDYFDGKAVDPDMKAEYDFVLETGLFDIVIFDYDKWFGGGILKLDRTMESPVTAAYRGWMMQPEQYQAFYDQLKQKNITLITPPEAYTLMHVFPNIAEQFGDDTAKMLLFPLHARIDTEELKKQFDRFMVKDYVKSVKGTEFPKFFDRTVTQEEFDRWMEVFYQYRGSLLTGGICIKEYLDLKQYGGRTNEYRVFYMNNHIATVCRNSGQGNYTPEVPLDLIHQYSHLNSPFYTVDYAELADGTWKVIEAGDGSVSGMSDNQDGRAFFRKLYYAFFG